MITGEEIQKVLMDQMDGAEVTVQDLTGSQDHWSVMVMWSGFQGKSLVEQHQMINKALAAQLEDGRIHALQIKTFAPTN